MSIVLEKNGKYVLKVYSHLDKVVQLTDKKEQAQEFPNQNQANWFVDYMKLQGFVAKTR